MRAPVVPPLRPVRQRSARVTRRLARVLLGLLPLAGVIGACAARGAGTGVPDATNDSVNVAYGTQARRDVTGSVGTVDATIARRSSPTNTADLIDGRFAGVEVRRLPGGGISVRIRGGRSLTRDGEPLYVLDGIPQHQSSGIFTDLDPRDIARIDVLRDAGSTAAYGSRGANGVILVTTVRAK